MERCIWLFLFSILRAAFSSNETGNELHVCLEGLGCVQGTYMPGYQAERFEAFMGIPFAKPPIGDLRLKNPQPATGWQETLMATTPRSHCIQKNYFIAGWPVSGEEDCLYLNLYRPIQRNNAKLPVLFYIHGGGYFIGSTAPGLLGPEYFMDTGEVILVVAAYRLGPFGFLSTGDENMPGNFGLKDQNLALRWVQRHVLTFGGDPDRVTIFGHSAGASSVHFHMLSAASKGLFEQGIMTSGSGIAPFVNVVSDPKSQLVQIAMAAGVSDASTLSTIDLANALRSIDPLALLNGGDSLKFWQLHPLINFRPTLEEEAWQNAFLTADPKAVMSNAPPAPVPWMMGILPELGEGAVFWLSIVGFEERRDELNRNFDNMLMQILEFPANIEAENAKMCLDMLLEEYMQSVHELNNQTMNGFKELMSDIYFFHPFYKTLEGYLCANDEKQSPVGLFKFNYRGPHSYSMILSDGNMDDFGVVHCDDMLYLFRTPLAFPQPYEKSFTDAELVKRYVGIYVDFAKNGYVEVFKGMGACTREKFQSHGDIGICNYLEIAEVGNKTFGDVVTNQFNVKRMRFLDELWAKLK